MPHEFKTKKFGDAEVVPVYYSVFAPLNFALSTDVNGASKSAGAEERAESNTFALTKQQGGRRKAEVKLPAMAANF
jgi:hypothetical protein